MKKFEYMVSALDFTGMSRLTRVNELESHLDQKGENGWELVRMSDNELEPVLVFKRELQRRFGD